MVNVQVDGRPVQVLKGSMIIQASDKLGIPVPRFCYHKKLTIAANCRMCLVEVEKMPKPAPACATPVMEGMVIHTQTQRALSAQRSVMEFLLINHPLDCPICDQGGECELQDVAMGYGRSVSRFHEGKRVVPDEDLGPLVATDMTRCIHCTRCVRFMDEIAGTQELGAMFRGEHLEIGTFVGRSLESELSGNIIDVCPVGALTNKVFRYRARTWELLAREAIAYHDALHSNLWLHTRRGEVLRTVPRDNEAINECWLSDRDRYSHQALQHAERIEKARVKRNGTWVEVDLLEAINVAVEGLRRAGSQVGALLHPSASMEDGALLAAIVRELGGREIEHRLRSLDTSAADPGFAAPLAGYEQAHAILLVGANPRFDQPILGHRIRKASKRGAQIHAINPVASDAHYALKHEWVVGTWDMLAQLGALLRAAGELTQLSVDSALLTRLGAAAPDAAHQAAVKALQTQGSSRILLGDFAVQHPAAGLLREAARALASMLGAHYDELPDGSNGIGLSAVGALTPGGFTGQQLKALLLQNVEPSDAVDSESFKALLEHSGFVVSLSAYRNPQVEAYASVLLPLALPPESEGSYLNVDRVKQSVAAGAKAPGDARPAWRIYRALAEAAGLKALAFVDFAGARDFAEAARRKVAAANDERQSLRPEAGALTVVKRVPMVRVDSVLRRSEALNQTVHGMPAQQIALHSADAAALGLAEGDRVRAGGHEFKLSLNDAIAPGSVLAYAGTAGDALRNGAAITLEKATP